MAYNSRRYNIGTEIKSGLDTFTSALNAAKAAREYRADAAIQEEYRKGMDAARAEAEASGGLVGAADPRGGQFQVEGSGFFRSRDDAMSAAAMEQDIAELQAMPKATKQPDGQLITPAAGLASAAGSSEKDTRSMDRYNIPEVPLPPLPARSSSGETGLAYLGTEPSAARVDFRTDEMLLEPGRLTKTGLTLGDHRYELRDATSRTAPPSAEASGTTKTSAGASLPPVIHATYANKPSAPAPLSEAAASRVKTATMFETPKRSAMDIFHSKYADAVAGRMMESGRIKDAAAFAEWSRSAKGQSYMDSWGKGMLAEMNGDTPTALRHMEDLYNKQVPDGQYARVIPGDGGKYTVEIRQDGTNKVLHSRTGEGKDLAQMALGGMDPSSMYQYLAGLEAKQADRKWDLEKIGLEHANAMALAAVKDGNQPPKHLQVEGADGKTYWHFWDREKGTYVKSDMRAPKNDVSELATAVGVSATRQRMGEAKADAAREAQMYAEAAKAVDEGRVTPDASGRILVNGQPITPSEEKYYAPYRMRFNPAPTPSLGID